MPGRPPIDLFRKVVEILEHSEPMPPEADTPLAHFRHGLGQDWNLIDYFEKKANAKGSYSAVAERHQARLNAMVLVDMVEGFERFLKESAAVCIDQLVDKVADDRLKVFQLHGGILAAHFQEPSIGRALCEAQTWLDCEDATKRYRRLLADPFGDGDFTLFPAKAGKKANPAQLKDVSRTQTLGVLWQIRHSIVHNVGVLTRSDAAKLKVLVRADVSARRVLRPRRKDLQYVRRFLDETADDCNRRIGERLAELLTTIHQEAPLFDAAAKADELSRLFMVPLQVAGSLGHPSPPGS